LSEATIQNEEKKQTKAANKNDESVPLPKRQIHVEFAILPKDLSVSLCGTRRHDHCIFIVDFFPQSQQEIQFLFLLKFKVQLFFVSLIFDPDFFLPKSPPPPTPVVCKYR